MNLNPLSLLETAINEHGSSVILRDRLALVKDMYEKVVKEKTDLEKKFADMQKELIEIRKQIPNPSFVEHRGVKFKRKSSGGYEHTVYCPSCEFGMAFSHKKIPFSCGRCHIQTSFLAKDLINIINELESS